MLEPTTAWLENGIDALTALFPPDHFLGQPTVVRALLAVLLVSLTCGAVGALVVGQRMSFFSDALAHCSFAGVALGLLLGLLLGAYKEEFRDTILTIMMLFGLLVGLLMAWVQEKTGLPGDTVIGVFFAGALGLGAIFLKTAGGRRYFNLESFLFGDVLFLQSRDLILLILLVLLTWTYLFFSYNTLVFSSFNLSLALSRQLRARLTRYLFVALLGLVVTLCLQVVGVLLVNAMLIVPAATAANFARNMRQLFWWSIALCLTAGWLGIWLSWEVRLPDPIDPTKDIQYGIGGVIVVTCVAFFILSMVWKSWRRATA